MKIGILGSGSVGQALGNGFVQAGHEVRIGTREPEKLADWAAKTGGKGSAVTNAEAAEWGEIVVLATRFTAAEAAIRLAGLEDLMGKVVIDVTNPLDFSTGAPVLSVGHTDSAGEQIQRLLPAARVVKAFNIVGAPHMFRPQFSGGPPDMFYCGDDDAAKATVRGILEAFGWRAIDVGGIEGARLLEPLAMLWIEHGRRTNTWNHAFKLLEK
jgi:hypothetical protein